MFTFVHSDLNRFSKDVFGTAVTHGDVGLTSNQYMACENIDFFHSWNTFDVNEVRKYGFEDIEEYRVTAVRCHIYNLIKGARQEIIATILSAYDCAYANANANANANEVDMTMTLENALKNVTTDTLFRVGWTFWSIPLGTFSERVVNS
jgi:hypothetical protein